MKPHPVKWLLRAAAPLAATLAAAADLTLLNVSYDPTREFYAEYNEQFAKYWFQKTGNHVTAKVSNGGSGKQARAVIDGLDADVVTLALAYDIDAIVSRSGLIPKDWPKLLPNNATPATSTIVFLVRKGNSKHIHDWNDLIQPGVSIVTPNPKTSGGARWNYLAAYGWALRQPGGSAEKAKTFVGEIYAHTPVLDTGARGALITFTQRGVGDVLIAWENEAIQSVKSAPDAFELVTPSETILAEPPVAVVDGVAKRHGTREVAKAYLEHLYSEDAQELAAKWGYRPRLETVAAHHKEFPAVKTFTIDEVFGGWTKAQKEHFADGGVFDQVTRR
jgi:sulfate/thiosulfate transport system substrate-binding protein